MTRRSRLCPVALLAAAALVALLPASASAGCGGTKHARPAKIDKAHRPPLAIGDSTMLLAVKPLARAGIEANARGCRQFSAGLDLIARLKRERRLAKVVIVALGPNGSIRSRDIRRGLAILGPKRILALVTNRGAGGSRDSDTAVLRAAGRRYPKRVRVLDWVNASAGRRGSYFSGDGLHLSFRGVDAFVRLLARAKRF
jgi:hypothetical protein